MENEAFDWSPQTGSSKDAQRDVRRQRSHKGCWEIAVTAEDDEEAEGRRTPSAHLLSGEIFLLFKTLMKKGEK